MAVASCRPMVPSGSGLAGFVRTGFVRRDARRRRDNPAAPAATRGRVALRSLFSPGLPSARKTEVVWKGEAPVSVEAETELFASHLAARQRFWRTGPAELRIASLPPSDSVACRQRTVAFRCRSFNILDPERSCRTWSLPRPWGEPTLVGRPGAGSCRAFSAATRRADGNRQNDAARTPTSTATASGIWYIDVPFI